jgi:hypothetical protein
VVDNVALNIAIWDQVVITVRTRVPREPSAIKTCIQANTIRVSNHAGGKADNVSVEDEVSDIGSKVDAAAREMTVTCEMLAGGVVPVDGPRSCGGCAQCAEKEGGCLHGGWVLAGCCGEKLGTWY